MKKTLFLIAGIFTITLLGFSKKSNTTDATPVLQKVMNRLKSLKSVSYNYKRIVDYPGEGYHDEFSVDSYLDFNSSAQVIGLRCQFSNSGMLIVYNGSEMFYCKKKEKTITTDNSPDINYFKNMSSFLNSPVTLKNALPGIIADKSIPKLLSDTTIDHKTFYVANIILTNETLNSLGDYVKTTKDLKFSYKLIIDKTTYMPIEVLQRTLSSGDKNQTLFTDINFSPAERPEKSWYSSSYENYTLKKDEKVELIKPGVKAPENQLAFFKNQKAANIGDFKGKLVLLEFWIKDCGHCIEDVPAFNAINAKYKGKDFKLLAVNTHDTKQMINLFMSKNGVKYDVLTGDNKIDKDYGVFSFPAVVLIDKRGTVIYASDGLDEKKLESVINQNI
jgi:thiol-disulfide isomerase/thioredoxin